MGSETEKEWERETKREWEREKERKWIVIYREGWEAMNLTIILLQLFGDLYKSERTCTCIYEWQKIKICICSEQHGIIKYRYLYISKYSHSHSEAFIRWTRLAQEHIISSIGRQTLLMAVNQFIMVTNVEQGYIF